MSARFFFILLLVSTAAFGTARAASRADRLLLARAGDAPVSLQEAARLVQDRYGARVLMAIAVNQNGRLIYRFKVLTANGEVRIVWVDAETGDME